MKEIKLNNVRVSYPNIFNPSSFGAVNKYTCTFAIPKEGNTDLKNEIDKEIAIMQDGLPKKVHGSKICFTDGGNINLESYEEAMNDYWLLKCSSVRKPGVYNADGLNMENDLFFGGCLVNAFISFWYSKAGTNKEGMAYPARILCNILRVQFVTDDGVRFGTDESIDMNKPSGFSNVSVKTASEYDDVPF